MIVELPTVKGLALFDVDSIQSVHCGQSSEAIIETSNSSIYTLKMYYEDMKKLWFKMICLKGKCDFITYEEPRTVDKNACQACGGLNLKPIENMADTNLKKCDDCGITQEAK